MANLKEEDLEDDFKLFLGYCWKLLGLPAPTVVQLRMADYLQSDIFGDRIIQMYRGAGKSWITSIFVMWKLWKDPDLKFAVVSATRLKADAFSQFCFTLMDVIPVLRHLKPRADQKGSAINWDVNGAQPSHSASCTTFSITGTLTGARADYVIADDIEVPENCATAMQREKLLHKVGEFVHIMKADEGKGNKSMVIYLGTPHNEDSLYNRLMDRGFHKRIWPARYPDPGVIGSVYKGHLCPFIEDETMKDSELVGRSTDPKRFSDAILLDKELKAGKSQFAMQYMLNTDLADAERYPLKLRDLIVFQVGIHEAPLSLSWTNSKESWLHELPAVGLKDDYYFGPIRHDKDSYGKFEGTVIAIDPSGQGKDETTYAVVKFLHGYVFLVAVGGLSGGYAPEVLKHLAVVAHQYKVNDVIVESNFGQDMFIELLKPYINAIHPVPIEGIRQSINKEKRIIATLEPTMNQHRLIVCPDVIEKDYRECVAEGGKGKVYSLFHQMTRLCDEKGALVHDDRIDVVAMAVNHFVEDMGNNPDTAADQKRLEQLEELVKKQLNNDILKKDKKDPLADYSFLNTDNLGDNVPIYGDSCISFIDNI